MVIILSYSYVISLSSGRLLDTIFVPISTSLDELSILANAWIIPWLEALKWFESKKIEYAVDKLLIKLKWIPFVCKLQNWFGWRMKLYFDLLGENLSFYVS